MMINVLLIIIILYLLFDNKDDGMTNNITSLYAKQVVDNAHLFSTQSTLQLAKSRFNWLDPVMYEDIRDAFRTNKFNEANIINILNV